MRKRQWWSLLALILIAGATCLHAAPPDGVLGANFNGEYQDINYRDLNRVDTHWIRGFIAMNRESPANVTAARAVTESLAAKAQ